MKFIEKTSTYKELRQDFDLQCLENSRKQDRILELSRINRELAQEVKELKEKIRILEEVKNDKNRKSKKSFNRK